MISSALSVEDLGFQIGEDSLEASARRLCFVLHTRASRRQTSRERSKQVRRGREWGVL